MWVIGNGESRADIDINTLSGPKIGCNAICRDYTVDHLICVDRRMTREALKTNTPKIYTRTDWINEFKAYPQVTTVPPLPYAGEQRPDDPFHWGSGPYAVLQGAKLFPIVKLIGFDLYSKTKTVNNIYKGTTNYNAVDYRAVDPRYWIYQIGKIFELYSRRSFIVYQEDDWNLPKAWNYPNVTVDKISNIV